MFFQTAMTAPQSAARLIVVFTDPDTLRDERIPSLGATITALHGLADQSVAVVLWGNETRAEMELIQYNLCVRHPFVSEHGGGLFLPAGYLPEPPAGARAFAGYDVFDFGRSYHLVAAALHDVAKTLGIHVIGFSGMSVQDIASDCRLSLARARLAALREYDEPFRIMDANPAVQIRLFQALRRAGLRCFTHEGYCHVTGVTDPTKSVRTLTSLYRQVFQEVVTVGLARDPGEIRLLQAVDIPVVVQSDFVDAASLLRKVPTARLINGCGPFGWGEAIWDLVNARSSTGRKGYGIMPLRTA